jgi:tripartite ATP-independent transporter DctM subunit
MSVLSGVIGILALFVLLAIKMPVGFAMMAVGIVGITLLQSWNAALSTLSTETFELIMKPDLTIIPLFVLMGNLAGISGISANLYDAANTFMSRLRGGLASATIAACAGFSALSGSSIAAAVTMGQVALPEMRRLKYNLGFSAATVAAGGTLGILIPPSTGLVLYALLTEQSIGQLFVAGVLPGILLTCLFIMVISLTARFWPNRVHDAQGEVPTIQSKLSALSGAFPFLGLVIVTVGGIYTGIFTPVESASVGVMLALVIALWRKSLTLSKFLNALRNTLVTSAMCYTIVMGANVLNPFLARSGLTSAVTETLLGLGLSANGTLLMILAIFLVLGTFMEGFAMLVLIVPIVFPVITSLGIDPIHFGILLVVAMEVGMITPPVGLNVFVVRSLVPDVPSGQIYAAILPFVIAMLACIGLLVAFPEITLYLPSAMYR